MLVISILCCSGVIWQALAIAPPAPYNDHCIVGETNKYNKTHANLVPWFTIDLDKPAFERWNEVATHYKQDIIELIAVIKGLTLPMFHGKLIAFVDKYLGNWDKLLGQPYHDEIMGIANVTGMPLGEIVLYNVFYELFTVCTSVVAMDPQGKLYHARTLDFGLFMGWNHTTHNWQLWEKLQPAVINVQWIKNGKPLYKSVNFAGYIGIYNGLKKDAFTITMNERFNINGGWLGMIEWLLGLTKNVHFVTFLVRETLEQAENYTAAMEMLLTQPIVAPAYFIVGGVKPYEGAIIARDRAANGVAVFTQMNRTDPNGWYVLETNYDLNVAPLYLDDRRTPGNACMQRLGQENVGFEGIFNVLSSKTNLNKLTEYTVLMQVNSDQFETHLQSCPQPCYFA
jgi:acid ceramidase